ncbi:MAG: hypothetical protein HYY10_03720 [Candidatus Liptonbacteria bacterium]|nr:hypothetical protein [Candidatus Liptonbacteria bacterium]
MNILHKEILEIPDAAAACYEKNHGLVLPTNVPYLAMGGASYAPLTLFYCGAAIQPITASEYFHYRPQAILPQGVLLSQSGESSETLWCLERFEKVIAVTNNPKSTLATSPKTVQVAPLMAGEEKFLSSTKTYVNMLIALYLGLGIDPAPGIAALKANFPKIQTEAGKNAARIHAAIADKKQRGLYVLGSGPNAATAMHAALILTETLCLPWHGMSLAQFDHGPKEAAVDAVVILLDGNGKDHARIDYAGKIFAEQARAHVIRIKERELAEPLTPLTLITHVCLLMDYLGDALGVTAASRIGSKITRVPKEVH